MLCLVHLLLLQPKVCDQPEQLEVWRIALKSVVDFPIGVLEFLEGKREAKTSSMLELQCWLDLNESLGDALLYLIV